MQPTNRVRRTSGRAVENRVIYRQYREKTVMITVMMILGVPSQMRVADSRSYLRMTSSRSVSMSLLLSAAGAVSTAGAVWLFFLKMLNGSVLL